MNKIFSHHISSSNAIIDLIYKKWLMRERHHETGLRWKGFSLGESEWTWGRGEGRSASGDRSGRKEDRSRERGTDRDRENEGEMEVGRALLEGNIVNVHRGALSGYS